MQLPKHKTQDHVLFLSTTTLVRSMVINWTGFLGDEDTIVPSRIVIWGGGGGRGDGMAAERVRLSALES